MISYVLINNTEREEFEKEFQLPYGCFNADVFSVKQDAIRLLNNMSDYTKKQYWIEIWEDGEFQAVFVKGEWLI